MSDIRIEGTDIVTSALGLGCSRLLGPIGARDAERLVHAAVDSGIRHFDVARAYGSGDAERVLGRALASRHERITVTTKFGILPPATSTSMAVAKGLARRAMRLSPRIRKALGRQGARMTTGAAFDVPTARRSIETSVQMLGVDVIDVLLLHEAEPSACTPEMLQLLEDLRAEGTIRAFGVGTSVKNASRITEVAPAFTGVVQIPRLLGDGPSMALAERVPAGCITHGVMSPLPRIVATLDADPALRSRWAAQIGAPLATTADIAGLLISEAVTANGRGPVIVSSTSAERMHRNAAAAERATADLRAFRFLVDGALEADEPPRV